MIPLVIETDDHLVDLFGKLMSAAGLSPTVCGPIGPKQLFENVVRAVPFLANSKVRPEDGLTTVGTPSFDLAWSIFTNGEMSLAVFVLIRFDDNFSGHLLRSVMQPLETMAKASGLSSSIASRGKADEDVVSAMRGAWAVPMGRLLAGEDVAPPPTAPPSFPPDGMGAAGGTLPPPIPPMPGAARSASDHTPAAPVQATQVQSPPGFAHTPPAPMAPAHPRVAPPPPPMAAPTAPPPGTGFTTPPPRTQGRPIPSGPAGDGGRILIRGANAPLSDAPEKSDLLIELGWFLTDPALELDATAILLGTDRRVCSDEHFVFFNNPRSPDGSVELNGDPHPTRDGYEVATISVRLGMISPQVDAIVFPVAIYDAASRNQSFGMIPSAYARVRSRGAAESQATFVMENPPTATESAMVFCEIYRRGGAWKVRAVGQGYANGLAGIATDYGVDVGA